MAKARDHKQLNKWDDHIKDTVRNKRSIGSRQSTPEDGLRIIEDYKPKRIMDVVGKRDQVRDRVIEQNTALAELFLSVAHNHMDGPGEELYEFKSANGELQKIDKDTQVSDIAKSIKAHDNKLVVSIAFDYDYDHDFHGALHNMAGGRGDDHFLHIDLNDKETLQQLTTCLVEKQLGAALDKASKNIRNAINTEQTKLDAAKRQASELAETLGVSVKAPCERAQQWLGKLEQAVSASTECAR